jgi:hypothetical protein
MSRERERPSWHPIWLACKACKHEWDDWQPANVPLRTWAAHIRTFRCPNCDKGGRQVLWRARPLNAAREAYLDERYPERTCDACGKMYRGPAVYCSIECAQADA